MYSRNNRSILFSFVFCVVFLTLGSVFFRFNAVFENDLVLPDIYNFYNSTRVLRGENMSVSFRNYSSSAITSYKGIYSSTNPEIGAWKEVKTQDTYWLTLPDDCQGELQNIKDFVQANESKYTDIVTVGMGGSSRPTDVVSMFRQVTDGTGANVHVLETLDEDSINNLLGSLNLDETLFIIISKSGGTAETMALANLAAAEGGDFVAITTKENEDSTLMKFLLEEQGVDKKEIQPHADRVGGRYTFFSNIGMLPAALAGVNVDVLLGSARRAMESDIKYQLGRFMADMEKEGRPYMRVILPESLEKLGPWIEQLVSESLGKHNMAGEERGIIAISERDFDSSIYGNEDVFAVRVKLGESDERNGFTQKVERQGAPIFEFQINSPADVAGVMYTLEFATGMSGVLMGIDPFNQPGVDAKKQITRDMKGDMEGSIKERISSDMPEEDIFEITKEEFAKIVSSHQTDYRVEIADGITLDFGKFVEVLEQDGETNFQEEMTNRGLDITKATDVYRCILELAKQEGRTYSAILPYNETYKDDSAWVKARGLMRSMGLNDVFGVGPVYEHSYSQFFHSGPNNGVFTFITSIDPGETSIPGDNVPGITFAMQNTLQALGAMEAEVTNDIPRLAIRIEVDGEFDEKAINKLEVFFKEINP